MKIVTKLPKVSVIIVNFNNAIYLNQSIDSILGQNYKNIEIIVVDNKSTDNSLYKLKKYKNKIIVLKNIKKSNQGSYNQINSYYKGYLKSKGEYIFFLDSDDYYKKNKIKLIINQFLKEKDIKLIFDLPIFVSNRINASSLFVFFLYSFSLSLYFFLSEKFNGSSFILFNSISRVSFL